MDASVIEPLCEGNTNIFSLTIHTVTAARLSRQCSLEYAKTKSSKPQRATNILEAKGSSRRALYSDSIVGRRSCDRTLSTRRQRHPATDRHVSDGTKFH